jgi:hypothetical protein
MKQARGMRNKNPLNIVKNPNINWQGEVKPSTDKNFAQFETLAYGCRAALKLLRTYYEKHKCCTISKIVRRWAPETENNVQAYIRNVSRMTGIGATTPLPPMKEETKIVWCDIVLAMATVECGLTAKQKELMATHIEIAWRLLNP